MKSVNIVIDNNIEYETYSHEEYSRKSINYILKRFKNKEVTKQEWNEMLNELNTFKTLEMVSHIDSIENIKFYS